MNIHRINFLGLLLFVLVCTTKAADKNENIINVVDYGAKPNDGKDDTKALRKAVEKCRTMPGSVLVFPTGTYELKDAQAVQLENDVMTGKFGQDTEKTIFTPYYPYIKGLDFSGAKDVTIMAEGATLLCEGWMEPVSLEDCTNVQLNGLTIDYKRKPFSYGTIVQVSKDYFDVRFSPERIIRNEIPFFRMTIWMKEKDRLYPNPFYYPKKEILENNIVRFYISVPEYLNGEIAGVLHSAHFRPAILVLRSQNIQINDVTIHSQSGMGIVGFDSKDIYLNRLSVVPAPGQTFSTNTDATHFACCEGLLRFDRCTFKGQGDDATNVHGYYQTITATQGNQVTLKVDAPTYTHAQVLDAPRIGDELELVEIKTLLPVKTYKVVDVVTPKAKDIITNVVLSDALPSNYSDYYLMNITKLPRLEFENCTVNSHLGRGVLVKTRNVLINNNVFKNTSGTAVHVGAESGWKEGSHAANVTITNNVMIGCGSGAGGQGGASGIAVVIDAPDTKATYLHDTFKIENNVIIGEDNGCGILISNAQNVRLKNNRVSACKQDLVVNSSKNVSISNE
jgi:polygalacturonase